MESIAVLPCPKRVKAHGFIRYRKRLAVARRAVSQCGEAALQGAHARSHGDC